MVYQWKSGARIKISAQVAGERIDALRTRLGHGVTHKEVLDDAQDPKSPLHSAFEWDDSLAAERFRLTQASHLLNCLVCVRIKVQHPNEDRPRIITKVRAFHSVVQNNERAYETTARVFKSSELREQLLQSAAADLHRFRQKYKQLKELSEVFAAVQAFRKVLHMPKKTTRVRKTAAKAA